MTTEYSINVDDWNIEEWEMTGRHLMYSRMAEKGTPQNREAKKRAKDCGCELEDVIDEFAYEHIPMMLYAYPLQIEPDEERIVEVCERTCCTVVQNNKTGDYFLALCGGGMDLSQDIALAYNIAQTWLPMGLLGEVSTQYGLSKSGEDFEQIRKIIIEQSEMESSYFERMAEKWKVIKTEEGKR